MAKNRSSEHTAVRQGDVLLTPVPGIPTDANEPIQLEAGLAILARGEVTGHHHSLPGDAVSRFMVNEQSMRRFVEISKPTEIRHQEHAPIIVLPGAYEVTIQREYIWGVVHTVAD